MGQEGDTFVARSVIPQNYRVRELHADPAQGAVAQLATIQGGAQVSPYYKFQAGSDWAEVAAKAAVIGPTWEHEDEGGGAILYHP